MQLKFFMQRSSNQMQSNFNLNDERKINKFIARKFNKNNRRLIPAEIKAMSGAHKLIIEAISGIKIELRK